MAIRNIYIAILFFICLSARAGTMDSLFTKEWKEIDSLLLKQDRTKSALEQVSILYTKAKLKQLPDQVIKCLIYQYSLQEKISSTAINPLFKKIEQEIRSTSDERQKAILHSLLAKWYLQYLTNNRWHLYDRKNSTNPLEAAITTWGIDAFHVAITGHFLQSLQKSQLLQQTNTSSYSSLIIKGHSLSTKSTLYDILVQEALQYFKSEENYISKPTYAFSISNEQALAPMTEFVQAHFLSKDSTSKLWMGIQLYQKLLSFHLQDRDTITLLLNNLDRIDWVYANALFSSKEAAYKKALAEITTLYYKTPIAAQAWYRLAKIEADKGSGYTSTKDSINQFGFKKAKEMAEKALAIYKDSTLGTAQLHNLLTEIARKELRTQTEYVSLPGKPFRALVAFRNIDTIYGRILQINADQQKKINQWAKNFWADNIEKQAYQSFTQWLPNPDDHQQHTVEIKIESLPIGEYALLTASSPKFDTTKDKISFQLFHVSNISYVKNKHDFFILRRDNGQPIENAKISIYRNRENPSLQETISEKVAEKTSNSKGYFRFAEPSSDKTFSYRIRYKDDSLNLNEHEYIYNDYIEPVNRQESAIEKYEQTNEKIFIFTDRAIYRPGQTMYFKGISITKDIHTELSKLITRKDSGIVYLRDVNQKRIDSIGFSINDYGSFHGKFILPVTALMGKFSLDIGRKNLVNNYFSVEEYKRPNFQLLFEKAKGSYRLNDSLTITGNVTAFAGNAIDGAKVVYSVKRSSRFMEPWYWQRNRSGHTEREISYGEIITESDGKFTIRFLAEAEDNLDQKGNPLFDFAITAEVTDINGETHSAVTTVTVGYHSLLLTIGAPAITEIDSLKSISISSTNLSYEKEPSLVKLKVYALLAPERMVRKRYWARPDLFVMDNKEFIGHFPTDEYEEESNYQTWPTGKLVTEDSLNTNDNALYAIKPGTLQAGYYRIEAYAKDKYGEEIKTIRYIQLFDVSAQHFASTTYQFNYTINGVAAPAQTASFISGSMADQLFLIRNIQKLRIQFNEYQFIDRKKGFETIHYTPEESDRGGVTIDEAYVFNNRVYTHQYQIEVPWNNKQLAVNYTTYRVKTEPGSKEKWTVSIQQDLKENVTAELLTAMYDASLDAFTANNWTVPNIWNKYYSQQHFGAGLNFISSSAIENELAEKYWEELDLVYDHLASEVVEFWDRKMLQGYEIGIDGNQPIKYKVGMMRPPVRRSSQLFDQNKSMAVLASTTASIPSKNNAAIQEESYDKVYSNINTNDPITDNQITNGDKIDTNPSSGKTKFQTRKNFNETAFFIPQLYADSTGTYHFSFTMPEANTEWKWMSIAHTKELAFGSNQTTLLTQKTMMVQPNAPRFMREGDHMEFSAKIVNQSDREITGQVSFELLDAESNTSVDGWFQNIFPSQYFTVAAGQSFPVKFPIQIPYSFNRLLTWRIIAKSGEYSDGEENTLPVVTNRMLVTESLPFYLPKDTTAIFKFEKLLQTNSESLTHESLTVEYTSNPVWYAIQALPYLMEYPYECAEQSFNRFYANTLASYIVNKYPSIKLVFEKWRMDSSSLQSKLKMNQELKEIMLGETPWVLVAESEEEQQKNIGRLFDLIKLSHQTESIINKLVQLQLPDGSFSWFKGGYTDRYITNYILTGIGKLKKLGALSPEISSRIRPMLVNALNYADSKLAEEYIWLVNNQKKTTQPFISKFQIEYLYMRSFFRDSKQPSPKAYQYFYQLGKQNWIRQNSYHRALLGLVSYRNGDENFAKKTILPALIENAVEDDKLGIYWKNRMTSFWYQSPIEHQSLMIAFLNEISQGQKNEAIERYIHSMKTWLLLNKQSNNWKTTIATADACYALLLTGNDWLSSIRKTSIQLGDVLMNATPEKTIAGTGYFKKRMEGKIVTPEMGNILVTTNSTPISAPSWGTVYWQYFEDLEKISSAASPLTINKQLFIEKNTEKGKNLVLVKEGDELKIGDKIMIRIKIIADRDMEYIHLKDMRAATMEPVNVLSAYKWQDGLGYYESTKDASSHFFISHLPKGSFVFNYPVYITHTGVFSVGIATIECMYAPEFMSHSAGTKFSVVN